MNKCICNLKIKIEKGMNFIPLYLIIINNIQNMCYETIYIKTKSYSLWNKIMNANLTKISLSQIMRYDKHIIDIQDQGN